MSFLTYRADVMSNKTRRSNTLEIPRGVATIPVEAHKRDLTLSVVDLRRADDLESIGERAFQNCRSLLEVYIAPNLKVVQAEAFDDCRKLQRVHFESVVNLRDIGVDAFALCFSLTNVSLPPTITTLGQGVFRLCEKLQSVKLPPNLNAIPDYAFANCLELQQINLQSTTVSKIGKFAFESCDRLSMIRFPSTLETIGCFAFASCRRLESILMTQAFQLKSIGHGCFEDCSSLLWVDLSQTILEEIQEDTFTRCFNLMHIQLNAELSAIGPEALIDCEALQMVEFHPSGRLKTIGPSAFQNCHLLNGLQFPSSLECIDHSAFKWCSHLDTIQFQQGLRIIEKDAYFGCISLSDVSIPSSAEYLSDVAFEKAYLERIDIQGDNLELSITLWSMHPDAFVGLSEEKWSYLYFHDDKSFISETVMDEKKKEKLELVKGYFANKLYKLVHWSIAVGSIGT